MDKHMTMRKPQGPMEMTTDPSVPQMSQVESMMTRIASLINSLEAKQQSLENRLNTVLSPVSPCADGLGDKNSDNQSPLVFELRSYGDKLARILAAFEEMEGRIEL